MGYIRDGIYGGRVSFSTQDIPDSEFRGMDRLIFRPLGLPDMPEGEVHATTVAVPTRRDKQRKRLDTKVTVAKRIDPLAFHVTCSQAAKYVQVTQQAISLLEKRVFRKIRHCLMECEREGLFDREDPNAGKGFLKAFSEALESINASKNAILIRPI